MCVLSFTMKFMIYQYIACCSQPTLHIVLTEQFTIGGITEYKGNGYIRENFNKYYSLSKEVLYITNFCHVTLDKTDFCFVLKL